MPNPATTHVPPAGAAWPDHSGGCFHPDDAVNPGHETVCCRPGDDLTRTGSGCFHPDDDLTLSTGTACFHPDDDRRDHSRVCFHPDDDRRGNGGRCYHASDNVGGDRIRAADDGTSTKCFRAADDGTSTKCFRAADDGTSTKCFHASSYEARHPHFRPAADEPVAIRTGGSVSPCHHPSEPGDHTGRPEDLAAGLHRTLTEFEQQHLAALSSRS
jgi:hypothetical protein